MSSSDSSSDSSSHTGASTYHPQDQECCYECPKQLFDDLGQAVVTVTATTVLSNQAAGTQPAAGQYTTRVITGTGFGVCGICKNQGIYQTAASIVLIPQNVAPANYNIYPNPAEIPVGTTPSGLVPNDYALVASNIVVSLTYYDKCGKKTKVVPYEAKVICADPVTDVALLAIDFSSEYNISNGNGRECIKNLPFLLPTPACTYSVGDEVYVISTLGGPTSPLLSSGESGMGIFQGRIAQRTGLDPTCWTFGEQGTLSIAGLGLYSIGAPVITKSGHYIGMINGYIPTVAPQYGAHAAGTGGVTFVTNRSYLDNQRRCLKYWKNGKGACERVEDVIVTGHGYVVPCQPWLGFNYRPTSSSTYSETLSEVATAPYLNVAPTITATGIAMGPKHKRIKGLQVLAVGGANLPIGATGAVGLFMPGGTTVMTGFTGAPVGNPPAYGVLHVGDIVVEFNGVDLGDQEKQVGLFSILETKKPCSPCENCVFVLKVRYVSEGWARIHEVRLDWAQKPPIFYFPWGYGLQDPGISAPVAIPNPVEPVANFVTGI